MTAFHEPDYISFLRHVTPDNQVRHVASSWQSQHLLQGSRSYKQCDSCLWDCARHAHGVSRWQALLLGDHRQACRALTPTRTLGSTLQRCVDTSTMTAVCRSTSRSSWRGATWARTAPCSTACTTSAPSTRAAPLAAPSCSTGRATTSSSTGRAACTTASAARCARRCRCGCHVVTPAAVIVTLRNGVGTAPL